MKTLAESIATLWCGTPPSDSTGSTLGWLLIAGAALVVAVAFVQAVRFTWWPGEESLDHPKRSILDDGAES